MRVAETVLSPSASAVVWLGCLSFFLPKRSQAVVSGYV